MKKFLKEKWQIVLIVLLLLFGMNKCTQSCNRQGKIDKLTIEYNQLDSLYKVVSQEFTDSIKTLNSTIGILNERVSGLKDKNSALDEERARTDEANARANDANRRANQLQNQLDKQNNKE